MNEEILSQEEIDTLMEVFSKKTLEDEATTAFGLGVEKRRDGFFKSIDENFQKMKRQFEKISELLSRSLVSSLSELLRRDVVLNNSVVEEPVVYEDFLASMNNPSCIGVLTSEMSKMTAFLELDLNLAYSIIDITLGGTGDNYLKIQRALTDLELELMKKPIERILLNLDKVLNTKLRLEKLLTYPSQISINSSHEVVVPIAFDIMAEESTIEAETTLPKPTHAITFCIPQIMIESHFSNQNSVQIDSDKDGKDKYFLEAIKKSPLINIPLRLQAHFPKVEMTIGKLIEMKIGDTIVLDMHEDNDAMEVVLSVEGCPKFKGKLGAVGRYKAVEITSLSGEV